MPASPVSKLILVRVAYAEARRMCIGGKGFTALVNVDVFRVVNVIEGRLNARSILVRAITSTGGDHPSRPTVGGTYTLRLRLAEATVKKHEKNAGEGSSALWVEGDEVELVAPPAGAEGRPGP